MHKYVPISAAKSHDLEFYTRVLIAVALCGLCVGAPFAIYHLVWGNPLFSMLLTPVIIMQSLSLYLLRKRGFNPWIALFLAVMQMSVTVIIHMQMGLIGSYWIFASAVANYYIVDRYPALIINVIACLASALLAFDSADIAFRFSAAFGMINVFLFAFSAQLEKKNLELDRMLTIDPLTRAGNRTALEEALRRVKSQYTRAHIPATVIMLDLDNFKKINDSQGHTTGDQILRNLSLLIQSRLRPTDRLFRFGGEEFIVITENTSMNQAAYLAEDIRKIIEADGGLTISAGLAELRADESTDELINRADRALYKAKSMGRNWVCFDPLQDGRSSGAAVTG
ncbi:GGDEF domain-containing protein [Pseudohongiella spirulinae]|uniref:GGDEF domain-containing protein n=1 Tax=Pseudohongiella spirulinae TaxID=1249552 RepID=UPI000717A942|nr:GGDEF domain-containing protein [Pseudohongiella spirulinae]